MGVIKQFSEDKFASLPFSDIHGTIFLIELVNYDGISSTVTALNYIYDIFLVALFIFNQFQHQRCGYVNMLK